MDNDEKLSCGCCGEVSSAAGDECPSRGIPAPGPAGKKEGRRLDAAATKTLVRLVVSLVFLIPGFFDWKAVSAAHPFWIFLYYVNPAWVSVVLCGFPFYKKAYNLLKHKTMKVPVLVSVAMTSSVILEIIGFFVDTSRGGRHTSYVFAAGEIALLMTLGGFLEELTVKKCRSGIKRLTSLVPTEANVLTEDGTVRKPLRDVRIGDVVLVKAGEMVPVDGTVISGSASVDQSSLTGESLPVDVSEGDEVFGGTFSRSGVMKVSVLKFEKDMTIARMAELAAEAEGKRAPISRLADKWVSIIVPSLLVLSVVVGLVTGFGFRVGAVEAVVRAITVLIVFCPCAFALATPTAVAAGLGNSARNGVLIKSGESLEELSRVDTVCFDKTGTLTEGNVELVSMTPFGVPEDELLRIAASVERYSQHPLALAVVKRAGDAELREAAEIETLHGVGISARVDGDEILVSSWKHALENGHDLSAAEEAAAEQFDEGRTVVTVFRNGVLLGLLAFSDTVRENAPGTVAEINAAGYRTVMLTGDNEKSARAVAEACNIGEVLHGLLPENKLRAVENIRNEGRKVCMVGDGVNDAPSMKTADVSMAMGAMGSDIAIETADMAILKNDVSKVRDTLRLSKRIMNTIRRNIAVAMSINVAAVTLAVLGYLNPATGAILHNCTSLLVVSSSAFLLYDRGKKKRA